MNYISTNWTSGLYGWFDGQLGDTGNYDTVHIMQPEFNITTLFFLSSRPIPKIISNPNLVPILALNPNLTLKKYIELTKMELDRVYLDCNKKNSAFSYKKIIIKEGSAEGTTARMQSNRIIMEVSDL